MYEKGFKNDLFFMVLKPFVNRLYPLFMML